MPTDAITPEYAPPGNPPAPSVLAPFYTAPPVSRMSREVAVPASRTAAGSPGDYAIDTAGGLLWVYTGDGASHSWATYVATNDEGELVANIALAEVSVDQVLPSGTLGLWQKTPVVGDGVTTRGQSVRRLDIGTLVYMTDGTVRWVRGTDLSAFSYRADVAGVVSTAESMDGFDGLEAIAFFDAPYLRTIGSLITGTGGLTVPMTDLYLPSLETITADDFLAGDSGPVTVRLPALVNAGYNTFWECATLQTLEVPRMTTVGPDFCMRTGLIEANFPSLVTAGSSLCKECSALVSARLPAISTLVDAFIDCPALRDIYLGGTAPTLGGPSVFGGTTDRSLITVHVPTGATGYDVAPWTDMTVVEDQ